MGINSITHPARVPKSAIYFPPPQNLNAVLMPALPVIQCLRGHRMVPW